MSDKTEILKNVVMYSPEDLFCYIKSGLVTLSEIYNAGYNATKRPRLEELMQEDIARTQLEESVWQAACASDLLCDYQTYVDIYPQGTYIGQAVIKIAQLKKRLEEEKELLFAEMRIYPQRFDYQSVNAIVCSDEFIRRKNAITPNWHTIEKDFYKKVMKWKPMKITVKELIINLVIPNDSKIIVSMTRPDMCLTQRKINEFTAAPSGRTDVYMIGIPRSGKSCVIGSIVKTGHKEATMIYQANCETINNRNVDLHKPYYDELIESMEMCNPPQSTVTETLALMKLDVKHPDNLTRITPINLFEIGGEIFKHVATVQHDLDQGHEELDNEDNLTPSVLWRTQFAAKTVGNTNKKMLFFIVDYSLVPTDDVANITREYTHTQQRKLLENILYNLENDGNNLAIPQEDCTMSKVDSVFVLLTKCDLMRTDDRQRRWKMACEYLQENYLAFMDKLEGLSRKYGFNSREGVKVKTFSLGKYYIGNSFDFDPTDAKEMIDCFRKNVVRAR